MLPRIAENLPSGDLDINLRTRTPARRNPPSPVPDSDATLLPQMTSKLPGQAFAAVTRPGRWRAPSCAVSVCSNAQHLRRNGFSSAATPEGSQVDTTSVPRWKQTPPAMKAPVRLQGDPNKPEFPVNSDPKVLDAFYGRLLGKDGHKMLSEEVKWQAVTHKSFDQGRRGFNDKLAYLGKQIVHLQCSFAFLETPPLASETAKEDPYGREPFEHLALQGLDNLTAENKDMKINTRNMAKLGKLYGVEEVLRWRPRYVGDLGESGMELTLTQALYAVIGAVALEKGTVVANQITRERILLPLGFRTTY
ncbi:hypothetical protein FQN52_006665 [Onygenales sp. PD_12]|nr:hypothetical protein FQN52_006665 [Onygenales sp. PD_12]